MVATVTRSIARSMSPIIGIRNSVFKACKPATLSNNVDGNYMLARNIPE